MPSIDYQALLDRCMGRIELMERLLANFQTAAAQEIADISAAIAELDSVQLQTHAHKLKGIALTVSAPSLANVADELCEAAGDGNRDSELAELFCQLSTEFESVIEQLEQPKLGSAHCD